MSAMKRTSTGKNLTFQDLVNQDLKTGKHRPVYLLVGPDVLRMEGVVEKIRKDALGEAGSAFNFHLMQGDQIEIGRALQQALALPMLGDKQAIWVKNIDKCLTDQASQNGFLKYIGNPVPETILICSAEKADKRKKWVKTCVDSGFYFDFSPPAGEALVQWVLKAAGREGLPLGQEEARLLCELVGNDLLGLRNEIQKLALLSETRGQDLTATELSRIIMDQAELDGFEITANLEPGKARDVLKTWFRLAEWGRSPYELVPLLVSRIRKAHLLALGRSDGLDDREIGSLTGTNPWSFKYLEPMIRGYGRDGLREALVAVLDCDRKLKGSPLKPDIIIEKLIFDLSCTRDTS